MNMSSRLFAPLLLLFSAAWLVTGCFNLKPVETAPRYFVLSPAAGEAKVSSRTGLETTQVVVIGSVKLPGYLAKKSLAIRKSANEIEYLQTAQWAENLEQGFSRVFAADLASRFPDRQVRRVGRNGEVSVEIHVSVDRFDVDAAGKGELTANYRILTSGKNQTTKTGQFRATRSGARPESDPKGATAALSLLVDDLSAELAKTVQAMAEQK
jgi:uncharacterized lipoprotein YmbA